MDFLPIREKGGRLIDTIRAAFADPARTRIVSSQVVDNMPKYGRYARESTRRQSASRQRFALIFFGTLFIHCLLRLPDRRVVACVRRSNFDFSSSRTALCWQDVHAAELIGYVGMVWHGGVLWVSYYSSHEGDAAVYLARVKNSAIDV